MIEFTNIQQRWETHEGTLKPKLSTLGAKYYSNNVPLIRNLSKSYATPGNVILRAVNSSLFYYTFSISNSVRPW